jgi:hypothetical protein
VSEQQQLLLARVEPVVELELVDGAVADEVVDVAVIAAPALGGAGPPPSGRPPPRRRSDVAGHEMSALQF